MTTKSCNLIRLVKFFHHHHHHRKKEPNTRAHTTLDMSDMRTVKHIWIVAGLQELLPLDDVLTY